jgi:DNA-binding CsgD family transcriptional regulator/transcriptional regulator with GAF, ATPase, and Fis domain
MATDVGPRDGERTVLDALSRIGVAFAASEPLEPLLDHLTASAITLARGVDGSVMLLSPDGQELEVVAAAGPRAEHKLGTRQGASSSVAGFVLRRGEPAVLQGRADGGEAASAHPRDLPCALVLPLRVGPRTLGVLSVNLGPDRPGPAERALELLKLLANQAALLIEVGRLVEELRRKEERLELFVDRLLRAQEERRAVLELGGADTRRTLADMMAQAVREYSAQARPQPPAHPYQELTAREREVLRLLVEGLTNREIGERLYLSPDTVKDHVREIIGKLGAADRTHAAVIAIRAGLVE